MADGCQLQLEYIERKKKNDQQKKNIKQNPNQNSLIDTVKYEMN